MNKLRLLFLSSQPDGSVALHPWAAYRAIEDEILRAGASQSFELINVGAAKVMDVARLLNQHRPSILHFNGHGRGAGELLLEHEGRALMPVRPAAMARLVRSAPEGLSLAFFCACHSGPLAQVTTETIDFAVGMGDAIEERAATWFAAAFYGALATGRTVRVAFDQALAVIDALRLGEQSVPRLYTRAGVDAARATLAGRSAGPLVHLRVAGTSYAYQAQPGVDALSIGRQRRKPGGLPDEGNDVVVRVPGDDARTLRISRCHLEIVRAERCWSLIDRSHGHTTLNGVTVPTSEPVPLRPGDCVGLAGVLFIEFSIRDTFANVVVTGPIEVGAKGLMMEASVGDMVTVRDD